MVWYQVRYYGCGCGTTTILVLLRRSAKFPSGAFLVCTMNNGEADEENGMNRGEETAEDEDSFVDESRVLSHYENSKQQRKELDATDRKSLHLPSQSVASKQFVKSKGTSVDSATGSSDPRSISEKVRSNVVEAGHIGNTSTNIHGTTPTRPRIRDITDKVNPNVRRGNASDNVDHSYESHHGMDSLAGDAVAWNVTPGAFRMDGFFTGATES